VTDIEQDVQIFSILPFSMKAIQECLPFGKACPGNPHDSCGDATGLPPFMNIFSKLGLCQSFFFLVELKLQVELGDWRISKSEAARLSHLHPELKA